jgi:hypothetical protein
MIVALWSLKPAVPGTGFYWTKTAPPAPPIHAGHRLAFIVVIVAFGLLFLAGAHS